MKEPSRVFWSAFCGVLAILSLAALAFSWTNAYIAAVGVVIGVIGLIVNTLVYQGILRIRKK
jgi:hypothetical protein